jgi:hypothetical protein
MQKARLEVTRVKLEIRDGDPRRESGKSWGMKIPNEEGKESKTAGLWPLYFAEER